MDRRRHRWLQDQQLIDLTACELHFCVDQTFHSLERSGVLRSAESV